MKILLFGATGSAGGGVLSACVTSSGVEQINIIGRRSPQQSSGKIRFFLHSDFLDYSAVKEAFVNVDACLFCLGIAVAQVSGEAEYRRITKEFAVAAAAALKQHSPQAVFHYLSGGGAARNSRFMWARVKAEAEAKLLESTDAVCWRPGAIDGEITPGTPFAYKLVRPFFGVLRRWRNLYVTAEDLGLAMLEAAGDGVRGRIIENAEIRDLADRGRSIL